MKNNYKNNKFDQIQSEISFIQFHTDLSREEKNKKITALEKQLERFYY